MNQLHSLWFDPGVTLGWSWIVIDTHAFSRPEHNWEDYLKTWDAGEFSGSEHSVLFRAVELIDEALNCVNYLRLHIGGEGFDRTNTPGSEENIFSPVRQNAVLDWECHRRGMPYKIQARQLRMKVTKDRLVNWGFEKARALKRNEFASLQHNVTWIRRLKKESLRMPWKLDTQDVINGGGWDCSCQRGKRFHNLTHPN